MKLKAVLDSEVTTKLLVAVRFAVENKSAASNFLYNVKTEIRTDKTEWLPGLLKNYNSYLNVL